MVKKTGCAMRVSKHFEGSPASPWFALLRQQQPGVDGTFQLENWCAAAMAAL
jgi:hypothetical protein